MIRFACPHCQGKLAAPEEKAGASTSCPQCRQRVEVPLPSSPPPVAELVLEPEPGAEPIPIAVPVAEPAQPPVAAGPNRLLARWNQLTNQRRLLVAAAACLLCVCLLCGVGMLFRKGPAPDGPPPGGSDVLQRAEVEPVAEDVPRPRKPVKRDGPPGNIVVAAKPQLVLDADGHTASVKRVLFTPDQQQLISVSQDKTVRVWDLASGETVRLFRPPIGEGEQGVLHAAALSPDGQWLALAGFRPGGENQEAGPIYVLSPETGLIDALFLGGYANVLDLAFSPDGKWLAAGTGDCTVRLYDFPNRKLLRTLAGGHREGVQAVAFSPEGRRLASVARDGTAAIWNLETGTLTAGFRAHAGQANGVSWSGDGGTIATGGADGTVRLWNPTGAPVKTFAKLRPYRIEIVSVTFTPDGRQLLCSGMGQGVAFLLDLQTGRQQDPATPHRNTVLHNTVSKDGKLAVTTSVPDNDILVWRTADGSVVHHLQGKGRAVWGVGWSPDGQSIGWGNQPAAGEFNAPLQRSFRLDTLEFGELPTPSYRRAIRSAGGMTVTMRNAAQLDVQLPAGPLHRLTLPEPGDRIYAYTLMGNRVVIGTHSTLGVIDFNRQPSVSSVLRGHTGDVVATAPHPNGRLFATGSADQTVMIWDAEKTEPLLSLFVAGPEWIVWTPQGHYAASPGGERLMGWHVNRGLDALGAYYPAMQFRKSLYRPDVIKLVLQTGDAAQALALADKARGQAAPAVTVGQVLPPDVVITSPDDPGGGTRITRATVDVKAVAKSTGNHPVTSLRLLVDGRPYGGARGAVTVKAPKLGAVQASWSVELPPGKHTLVVQAESAVSKGLSPFVEVVRTGGSKTDLPNLYIVAAGISAYPGKLRLDYAASDAQLMTQTLQQQQGKVYQKVEAKLILDKQATRAGVLEGLTWLSKKMGPQDIGVIFLSGHGTRDERGNFYYVPFDVNLKDPTASCLSGEQIKPILEETPGRVILMLDACHSGAAAAVGGTGRGLADNLIRDLVTDDYGVIVVSSSRGNEFSLESAQTKAGFFTYAVTEGLKGPADLNRDQFIHLSEIEQYAVRRVDELSGGEQHPVVNRPPAIRSFPLARR